MQNLIEQLQQQIAALQAAVANGNPPAPSVTTTVRKPQDEVERIYWAQFDWAAKSDREIAKESGAAQPTVSAKRKKFGFPVSPRQFQSRSLLETYTREQLMTTPLEELVKKTGLTPGAVRYYGRRKGIPILPEKKLTVLRELAGKQAAPVTPEAAATRRLHKCREALRRMRGILTTAYNTPGAVSGGTVLVTEAEIESWLLDTRDLVEGGQQS